MVFRKVLAVLICASLTALASQVLPESSNQIVCDEAHAEEPSQNCYSKIFVATNEFQIIRPNQVVPPGLHVRLNLQTGIKEAKLMNPSEQSDKDRPTLKVQLGQRKDLITKLPESHQSELNPPKNLGSEKTEIFVYGPENDSREANSKGLTVQEQETLREIMDKLNNGTQSEILAQLKFLSDVCLSLDSSLTQHFSKEVEKIGHDFYIGDAIVQNEDFVHKILSFFNDPVPETRAEAALLIGNAVSVRDLSSDTISYQRDIKFDICLEST